MMKATESPVAPDSADSEEVAGGLATLEQSTTPKRKAGRETAASCPPHCTHSASLPSDMLIEMKVCLNERNRPGANTCSGTGGVVRSTELRCYFKTGFFEL